MAEKQIGTKSVAKALTLLSYFTAEHPYWGIRELSNQSGIDPSSVYKLLNPFLEREFLQQDPITKRYKLGVQFIRYANLVEEKLDVVKIARPYMEVLAEEEHGTVNISLFIGEHVFHKLEATYDKGLQVITRHAESDCLHRTANGRMILSTWTKDKVYQYIIEHDKATDTWSPYPHKEDIDRFWEELQLYKRQGYATASSFQFFPDVVAIAVPIHDQSGAQVAGLSYYEIIHENYPERSVHLAEKMKQFVNRIEAGMGWR